MVELLFNRLNLLEKGLDASALKGDVIANNIANADTPDFKSSAVEFESVFRDALEAESGGSVSPTQSSAFAGSASHAATAGGRISQAASADLDPLVTRKDDTTLRMDGNNVDVDTEMTELAKNSILYDTLSYTAAKELGRLRMIISEGK